MFQVLERGLKAIPLSVDLWIHYLNHIKSTRTDDHTYIRSQYERAIGKFSVLFCINIIYLHIFFIAIFISTSGLLLHCLKFLYESRQRFWNSYDFYLLYFNALVTSIAGCVWCFLTFQQRTWPLETVLS